MKFKQSFGRRLEQSYPIFRMSCRCELCFHWFNWLKICYFEHFLSLFCYHRPAVVCIRLHFYSIVGMQLTSNEIANMIVISIWYCHVKFIIYLCVEWNLQSADVNFCHFFLTKLSTRLYFMQNKSIIFVDSILCDWRVNRDSHGLGGKDFDWFCVN